MTNPTKYFLSWEEYQKLVEKLAEKLRPPAGGKKYDAIYGIPRGGLPIAVSLSHLLDLPVVMSMSDKKYKNILVVDDISDSGRSMTAFQACPTAALFMKPHTKCVPNYFAAKTTKWIVFPWETEQTSKYDNV